MRKISALALTLALVGCSGGSYADTDLLKNPLYAEYYYDDLVETMVSIELNDPKAAKDDRKKKILDDVRRDGLKKAQEANDAQDGGTKGNFIQANEFTQGEALYVNGVLYFSPDFIVAPGPELHVYLSKVADPRDAEAFPTIEDIDLGLLRSPYGPQEYATPELDHAAYRTVVIYDALLKHPYAFAQLSE